MWAPAFKTPGTRREGGNGGSARAERVDLPFRVGRGVSFARDTNGFSAGATPRPSGLPPGAIRARMPPRRHAHVPSPGALRVAGLCVALAASRPAHARDVTLKVHDMAGALPAGTRVEVQLLQDNGAPLGAPLLPRDDGAAR